jgi:hypothetical protein
LLHCGLPGRLLEHEEDYTIAILFGKKLMAGIYWGKKIKREDNKA